MFQLAQENMLNPFRAVIIATILGLVVFFLFFSEQSSSTTGGELRVKRAAIPAVASVKSIMYWGQNKLGVAGFSTMEEPSLLTVCQQTSHEVIVIAFIKKHFSTSGIPGLELGRHCTKTVFSGDKFGVDFYPLKCTQVESDIRQCQNMGKKVLISISPLDILSSTNQGQMSAQNVWNYYLGGQADLARRPFGSVVLDGVDLFFRTNDGPYVTAFAKEISRLMVGNAGTAGKQFILSASPRCSFPDAILGPDWSDLIFSQSPQIFSMIVVHGMSCPDCTWRNSDIMVSTVQKWINWINQTPAAMGISLYVSLPVKEGWIDDAPGDYIKVSNLLSQKVYSLFTSLSSTVKGFAVWEGSAEMSSKPCLNDEALISSGQLTRKRRYGDLLRPEFQSLQCDPVDEATDPDYTSTSTSTPSSSTRRRTTTSSAENSSNLNIILSACFSFIILYIISAV